MTSFADSNGTKGVLHPSCILHVDQNHLLSKCITNLTHVLFIHVKPYFDMKCCDILHTIATAKNQPIINNRMGVCPAGYI